MIDASTGDVIVPNIDEAMKASLRTFVSQQAKGWDRIIQYKITGPDGGYWYIAIKDGKYELKKGAHEKPDLEFEMDSDTFVALSKGEISAIGAFMQQKMKAKATTNDLMRMGQVFPTPTS
jgi:putative sterol carrier protein